MKLNLLSKPQYMHFLHNFTWNCYFILQDPDKDGDKPRMQTYDVDLNT